MELSGKIVNILPLQTGESKNGTWKKQEFILETPGQYPKSVCISVWGDKIDQMPLRAGETVTAYIDVESREYNNRWYTEVKAWKVMSGNSVPADSPPPQGIMADQGGDDEMTNDLPF